MKKTVIAMSLMALAGCAFSPAGLGRMPVEHTLASNKPAQVFATCVAEILQGQAELRGSGSHYWILRENGYGVPIVRWDFTDQPNGGSLAELRASGLFGAAKDKVQRCA